MRHIIHDWDDEKSITILKNIRKVLPEHGKVLVVEAIVEPGNAPSMAKSLDLTMLLMPGGQERTVRRVRAVVRRLGAEAVADRADRQRHQRDRSRAGVRT